MTRTPEPMSIYHPLAATPRRIETVKARSSFVPPRPKMTWAEMARAEGHGPNQPLEGGPGRTPQPQSTAGRIRAHLAAHGSSTSHEISNGTGIPPTRVSDALGSMQRYGSVRHADEARRKYPKDILSDEERRAIDAAVQAGRVRRVDPGVSAFSTEYEWCPKANQLVLTDNSTRRSFNPSNKPHLRRQAKNYAENVARAKAMRAEGHTQAQIMRALGIGKSTVQKYMAEIGEPVSREKAAELGARVKKARKMWAAAHKAKPDMSREDRRALLTKIAAAVDRSEDTARSYIRDAEMGTK